MKRKNSNNLNNSDFKSTSPEPNSSDNTSLPKHFISPITSPRALTIKNEYLNTRRCSAPEVEAHNNDYAVHKKNSWQEYANPENHKHGLFGKVKNIISSKRKVSSELIISVNEGQVKQETIENINTSYDDSESSSSKENLSSLPEKIDLIQDSLTEKINKVQDSSNGRINLIQDLLDIKMGFVHEDIKTLKTNIEVITKYMNFINKENEVLKSDTEVLTKNMDFMHEENAILKSDIEILTKNFAVLVEKLNSKPTQNVFLNNTLSQIVYKVTLTKTITYDKNMKEIEKSKNFHVDEEITIMNNLYIPNMRVEDHRVNNIILPDSDNTLRITTATFVNVNHKDYGLLYASFEKDEGVDVSVDGKMQNINIFISPPPSPLMNHIISSKLANNDLKEITVSGDGDTIDNEA